MLKLCLLTSAHAMALVAGRNLPDQANTSQQCRYRPGPYLCQHIGAVLPPRSVHNAVLQGAVYDLVTPRGASTGFVLKILNTRIFAMCTGVMQNFERVSER